jgi:CheY-like chemotaxis protein
MTAPFSAPRRSLARCETLQGDAIMAVVLVADEIKSVRYLLRLTIGRRHTVIEARDGDEALALLRQHRPDVAVLDVTMPARSGLQVCRLLRADPDLRGTGVIVMSANGCTDAAYQAGADRFPSPSHSRRGPGWRRSTTSCGAIPPPSPSLRGVAEDERCFEVTTRPRAARDVAARARPGWSPLR